MFYFLQSSICQTIILHGSEAADEIVAIYFEILSFKNSTLAQIIWKHLVL